MLDETRYGMTCQSMSAYKVVYMHLAGKLYLTPTLKSLSSIMTEEDIDEQLQTVREKLSKVSSF